MSQPAPIPPSVTIKPGHVQPVWAGHPWVFRQAVQSVDKGVEPGGEVLVIDPHGKVLGRGLYSPQSAIAVRLFTRHGGVPVDGALVRAKIERAVALRQAQGLPDETPDRQTTGFRLVHAEGDGLPGLVVDLFDDVLVVQLGTAGLKRLQDDVIAALRDTLAPRAIIDRTPKSIAKAEGFEVAPSQILHGEAPELLRFHERGFLFELPLSLTQKTGFYFDQRPLRERIEAMSRGSRVLDACCYVGGIAFAAARGGAAEVWAIDKSAAAIDTAKNCAELNGLATKVRFDVTDTNTAFKKAAEDGAYDIVICDPPKLASGRRTRNKAFGGYRKLAAGACGATKAGGVLAFCSCSASVSMEALQRCLALGARDVGRRAVVFERIFQGPDHPVLAAFPEGLYLKTLLARIDPE